MSPLPLGETGKNQRPPPLPLFPLPAAAGAGYGNGTLRPCPPTPGPANQHVRRLPALSRQAPDVLVERPVNQTPQLRQGVRQPDRDGRHARRPRPPTRRAAGRAGPARGRTGLALLCEPARPVADSAAVATAGGGFGFQISTFGPGGPAAAAVPTAEPPAREAAPAAPMVAAADAEPEADAAADPVRFMPDPVLTIQKKPGAGRREAARRRLQDRRAAQVRRRDYLIAGAIVLGIVAVLTVAIAWAIRGDPDAGTSTTPAGPRPPRRPPPRPPFCRAAAPGRSRSGWSAYGNYGRTRTGPGRSTCGPTGRPRCGPPCSARRRPRTGCGGA